VRRRVMFIVAGVTLLAVFALGGAALAGATQGGGDDAAEGETTLTGEAAEQARSAALKETGGGTVRELERDPEEGRVYEVEVKKPDGSVVDLDLDGSFKVVAVDEDKDEANEKEQTDSDD
jgi:uncharacterized membrane protein YkoI